jgi:hypothetical protein
MALWSHCPYLSPFFPLTFSFCTGAHKLRFSKPSSATGSASRHLHFSSPWVAFHYEPPGCLFLISWPGTHAHCHIYLIHVHIWYYLQILFTLGIWLLCVQVLDPSSLHIIPSGIYSALACSLSRCNAFTFPVTPSDIGL